MGARLSSSTQTESEKTSQQINNQVDHLTAEEAHQQADDQKTLLAQAKANRCYRDCHEAIQQAVNNGQYSLTWPQPNLSGNPHTSKDFLTPEQQQALIALGYQVTVTDAQGPVTIRW